MLNYLYYKLYRSFSKTPLRDIPEFVTPIYFAILISMNLISISAFFAKLDMLPFPFPNSMQVQIFGLIVMVSTMLYYRKARYEPIIKKYSKESDKKRIRGNIIVAIYVVLSFLLFISVGFFKPGKL